MSVYNDKFQRREKTEYHLPRGCDLDDVEEDIDKYESFHHDNQTYITFKKIEGGTINIYSKRVANFIITPLFMVIDKETPLRILFINNTEDKSKVVMIPPKVFSNTNELSASFSAIGNYHFEATKVDSNKVLRKVYDKVDLVNKVNKLGWNSKLTAFIFSNGAYKVNSGFKPINEEGIVKVDKEKIFIPFHSPLFQEEFEQAIEKDFHYKYSEIDIIEWSDLFIKTYKENGMIALLFLVMSPFRDIVQKQLHFTPILFLFGQPGSGKNQLGLSLMSLFGKATNGFQLNAGTNVAFYRHMSHYINGIAWFDEYSNDIEPKRIQSLKGAYDGMGHARGNKNNESVNITAVNSSILISGQHLPTADVALFTRSISLNFFKTSFSEEDKSNLNQLRKMENEGLSPILTKILSCRNKVEELFLDSYEDVRCTLDEALKNDVINTRMINNNAVLLGIYRIVCRELNLQLTYKEVLKVCIDQIKQQASMISNAKETTVFWDTFEFLIAHQKISANIEYKIVKQTEVKVLVGKNQVCLDFPEGAQMLYIRLNQVQPLYKQHLRSQGDTGLEKSSLENYLKHDNAFVGTVKNTRFHSGPTSAMVFNLSKLSISIFQNSHSDEE